MDMPNAPIRRTLPARARALNVTAVLGPTNTGKTHLAIERMAAHESGMIGLPLRLLAREVHGRLVEKMGEGRVALITGEEKIRPPHARHFVCTVEAMPGDVDVAFLALDEAQLGADLDRGHVFTDRLLNRRGRAETMIIGAMTLRPLLEKLIPGIGITERPRLSQLLFAGEKKLTRLPRRSAIVAFSAEEVYAIAELIRRQNGGAAVVMGALSPRTRNAQVALFQSGDVDYIVATDAIGMGLNLDVAHVAFASDRKFDGHRRRRLEPGEFGQIAGRAGRHLRDGTFGTTGRCPPFEPELVEALEAHRFDALKTLQWRNSELDFASMAALKASLAQSPTEEGLTRALAADDVIALEHLSQEADIARLAQDRAVLKRLWEVCQLPDYRKISPHQHAELAATLFRHLMQAGRLPEDWFGAQIAALDRTDGDLDALSTRLAQIRTWSFAANRADWLADPRHWQGEARRVEDRLSDALHEQLAARFVDRRTSVLMRRLREKTMLEANVSPVGDVTVEGQHVGMLQGFRFTPDSGATGPEMKALNAAAGKALTREIESRAARLVLGGDEQIVLANDGLIRWGGEPVARIAAGDRPVNPGVRLIADDILPGTAREQVEARLAAWLKAHVARLLGPLLALESGEGLTGSARGIAFQIAEALGVLERSKVATEVKSLDQEARAALRKQGVRFGAYHLYVPALLKPAPRALAVQLFALGREGSGKEGAAQAGDTGALADILHLAASGRTSIPVDSQVSRALYLAGGYRVCGERAVRVDILERLADLIRPAMTYRPGVTQGEPPAGAADGEGFTVTNAMTSLVGVAGADFAGVLRALGYASQTRTGPAITVKLAQPPAAPVAALPVAEAPEAGTDDDQAFAAEATSAGMAEAAEATAPEPVAETMAGAAPDASPAIAPATQEATQEASQETTQETTQETSQETTEAENGTAAAEATSEATSEIAPEAAPEVALEAMPEAAAQPPVEIEIWSQHRGQRREQGRENGSGEARRHHRRDGRPQRGRDSGRGATVAGSAEGAPATDGNVAAAEQTERKPGENRRWEGRRQGGKGGGQEHRRDDRPRNDQARGDRPQEGRQEGGRDGRPENRRDGRQEWRQDGRREGGRHGSGAEGHGGGQRQNQPRQERQPDPNSPFAKLLALKAELEQRGKG
jgi:ATP-dependent RNA helicase SUPV3L1/SUV3